MNMKSLMKYLALCLVLGIAYDYMHARGDEDAIVARREQLGEYLPGDKHRLVDLVEAQGHSLQEAQRLILQGKVKVGGDIKTNPSEIFDDGIPVVIDLVGGRGAPPPPPATDSLQNIVKTALGISGNAAKKLITDGAIEVGLAHEVKTNPGEKFDLTTAIHKRSSLSDQVATIIGKPAAVANTKIKNGLVKVGGVTQPEPNTYPAPADTIEVFSVFLDAAFDVAQDSSDAAIKALTKDELKTQIENNKVSIQQPDTSFAPENDPTAHVPWNAVFHIDPTK